MLKPSKAIYVLLLAWLTLDAHAESEVTWGISAGQINVFSGSELKNMLYGIETRFNPVTEWNLVPTLGYNWGDGGLRYLYHDLKYPIELNSKWRLYIGSGIGFYENSPLLDLGHKVEFRSGVEIDYVIDAKQMIGITANHYSNSRLSDRNPGTESIALIYLRRY